MLNKLLKLTNEAKTSYMFPTLHQDVSKAVSDDIPKIWFNTKTTGSQQEYSTNVMGKFRCENGGCTRIGWGSKRVAILIRGFAGNGYNAVVFNQRCQSCNKLGLLALDVDSYIDRVGYRLKKWAGVRVQAPQYTPKKGLPHKTELCEGCKEGYCLEGEYEEDY
ncbi:zinc-binding domain-containing protein [Hypoxylon sp. FL1284]|nr:zinc-binding domain-containing protein [Hypoxylon sp. FL1284]